MKVTSLRFLLATTMFILLVSGSKAQSPVTDTYVSIGNTIAPSPGASSLAQFASMPVNLSNGTVNISIPLTGLQGYSMTLPVSLSYQTSGIRVNDVASQVGLGWSLNAGGVITRVVRDKPDDEAISASSDTYYHGYAGANYNGSFALGRGAQVKEFIDPNGLNYTRNLDSLLKNHWDSEPDIYYFNFLGRTGKFILDERKKPILIPQQDIRIDLILPTQNSGQIIDQKFATWVITTNDGTSYIFGNPVAGSLNTSTASEQTEQKVSTPEINSCLPANTQTSTFASSWYLKEIISPKGNTEFTFDYKIGSSYQYNNLTAFKYEFIWNKTSTFPDCKITEFGSSIVYYVNSITKIINPFYVEQINSPATGGKIKFNYQSGREDLVNAERLESVQLINERNQAIKNIKLEYSYFSPYEDYKRLKLDKIQEGTLPAYEFTYNTERNLPERNSPQIDHWGYFNGRNLSIGNAIPASTYDGYFSPSSNCASNVCEFTGADRSPDEENMQANILTEIKFPTGGYVKYEYGMNEYYRESILAPGNKSWGGLRIEKMTLYDGISSTNPIETIYQYKNEAFPLRSSGTVDDSFDDLAKYRKIIYVYDKNILNRTKIAHYLMRSSQPVNPNGLSADGSIVYGCVTVLQNGKGKTVHLFTNYKTTGRNDELPIIYKANERLEVTDDIAKLNLLPYMPRISHSWERALATDVKVYSEDGKFKSWKHFDYDFNANPTTSIQLPAVVLYSLDMITDQSIPAANVSAAYYGVYHERSQWVRLWKITDKLYNQQDDTKYTETITQYEYNPHNLQVASVKQTDSENTQLRTFYKYPIDYVTQPLPDDPADLTAVIHEMERRHIRAIPIETQVWQQKEGQPEVLLSASLTDFNYIQKPSGFKHWLYSGSWPINPSPTTGIKTTMILPNKFLQLHTNVSLSTYPDTYINTAGDLVYDTGLFTQEKTITHYDLRGNALDVENRDDIPVAVIYDNTGALPLAKIANAMHSDVAYSSFEYNDGNSWSYSVNYKYPYLGEGSIDQTKSGDGYYLMTNAADNKIIKTGLDASKKYLVSFWAGKGGGTGTIKINSQDIITTISDQSWQYYETIISGASSIEITFIGSNGFHLDELRLHPIEARMSTYTYKSHTGISTATDANAHSVHQEYDSFERVSVVRDQDKNIVKQYAYQYMRRNEPYWVSTNTTRCAIGSNGPTGYIEEQQKDNNPYSSTYNQFRWIVKNKDLVSCEPCRSNQKWINNACKDPIGTRFLYCEPIPNEPGSRYDWYCYEYEDGSCSNSYKVRNPTPCQQ